MDACAHWREAVGALSVVVAAIALTRAAAELRVRRHLVVLWVHAWVRMCRWVLRLVMGIVPVGAVAKVSATLERGGWIGAVSAV